MNELRLKKSEGQILYLVDRFPPLDELKAMTFLGSFSWTSQATKERWLLKRHAYNLGAGWISPSDIARDYIEAKYGKNQLRCNSRQWREVVRKRKHQPLFAIPCTLENGYYLDLKSAYWQILMIGGWDVDYMPGRYLSPRSDVSDFPASKIKLARNCLVSMGLPSGVNTWIPDEGFQRKSSKKASANLVLWGFVQDVLHGFASDMVNQCGAIYVNTDGYIVPADRMPDAENVSREWGLTVTLKHSGLTTVRGAGDYSIGERESARIRTMPKPFEYLRPRAIDWLRAKIKHWSYRINWNLLSYGTDYNTLQE